MITSNRGKHCEDRRYKKKRWNAVKGTRIIEWQWNANWDEIEFHLRERCFSLRAALPCSFFPKINPMCINSYDLWRGGPQYRYGHMSQWIRRIYCIRTAGETSDEERVMTGCCRCLLAGGQQLSASWGTNRRESTLCILMSQRIAQVHRLKKKEEHMWYHPAGKWSQRNILKDLSDTEEGSWKCDVRGRLPEVLWTRMHSCLLSGCFFSLSCTCNI